MGAGRLLAPHHPGAVARQFEVLTNKARSPWRRPLIARPQRNERTPKPTMVTGQLANNEERVLSLGACIYRICTASWSPAASCSSRSNSKLPMVVHLHHGHGERKDHRDAWEAFTQSQAYRCPVQTPPCFRPDMPPAPSSNAAAKPSSTPLLARRSALQGWGRNAVPYAPGESPTGRTRPLYPALLAWPLACSIKGVKFQWRPCCRCGRQRQTLFTDALPRP